MTTIRRSGRSARASSARASPRSAPSARSWNSSNSTAAIPSRPGSSRMVRTNTPSVTTSIRLPAAAPRSNRALRPIERPSGSPSVAAMRSAAARAARRRGSTTTRRPACAQGSSSRARGSRVVLPAPGGATSTSSGRAASAARTAGSTASMGSGASVRFTLRPSRAIHPRSSNDASGLAGCLSAAARKSAYCGSAGAPGPTTGIGVPGGTPAATSGGSLALGSG